jgi:hypothetical protein
MVVKLRYVGQLEKTLIDVAALEFGKVIDVAEDFGAQLLRQAKHEWEVVTSDASSDDASSHEPSQEDAQEAPQASSPRTKASRSQEEVTPEVSA